MRSADQLDEFAALAHYRALAWRIEELLEKADRALTAVEELVEGEELQELDRSLLGEAFRARQFPEDVKAKTTLFLEQLDNLAARMTPDLDTTRTAARALFETLEDEVQRRRSSLGAAQGGNVAPLRRVE